MLRSMPTTPKVVPLDQHRFRVIAADEETNRIIIATSGFDIPYNRILPLITREVFWGSA